MREYCCVCKAKIEFERDRESNLVYCPVCGVFHNEFVAPYDSIDHSNRLMQLKETHYEKKV